jgi:hypothetical protein
MTDEGCTGEGRGRGHTYTEAEVKILTEAALRLGRKEAGEEIADALEAEARRHSVATAAMVLDAVAAPLAREIGARALSQPSGAASDASSGVPEGTEAGSEPQAGSNRLPGDHHPVGIRSTDVGVFVRCSCGENPTPKLWIERHWPGDRAEGERLVRDLVRITKGDT